MAPATYNLAMPRRRPISIRRISTPGNLAPADAALLDRLADEAFGYKTGCPRKCYHWLAYDRQTPVAFAALDVDQFPEAAFFAHTGVIAPYRGRGIQRRFIRLVERLARRLEFSQIVCTVHFANPWSLNNFIREGWLAYRPDDWWGQRECVYIRKSLS